VAVIWGWGVAQYPYLLPQSLTIKEGAGASGTLTGVLIVFGVAIVVVLLAVGAPFRSITWGGTDARALPSGSAPRVVAEALVVPVATLTSTASRRSSSAATRSCGVRASGSTACAPAPAARSS
jgi:hypothetical protein